MKTNLLKSIFISLILVLGVSSAWAAEAITFSGGYIYFDNSIGINQTYIQLCARQSSWTGVSTLNKINNTKLHYVANPQGSGWGGILGWVVIGNSSQKTNSNFDNWSTYGWCSAWNTYGFNDGSTYLIVPSSTSKSQSVNTSYYSGGYSALNSDQTINTVVDGTVASSKATISLTSYKMTGNGAVTKQEATHGTGSKDSYISAARTATTTFTVGAVATGYQFDGWYTEATGGTQLEADETYTYYPTAATTVYARFSTIKYTVTYGVHSSGNGTLAAKVGSTSISSGNKENYGSKVVFTATPSTGYEIEGWYSNTDCTTSLNNGTDKTYTIESLTAEATVYVKFKRKQHTINFGVHSSGNGTLTAKVGNTSIDFGDKVNYGSTIVFTATPSSGYQIEGWYKNSDCTISLGNGTNNTYTVTITGGTNVYVKFIESDEKTYPVTVTATAGGTVNPSGPVEDVGSRTATTFTATPDPGYRFGSWDIEGDIVKPQDLTNPTISITANGSGSLTANFIRVYTVKYYATPTAAGSVTAKVGENTFTAGDALDVDTRITFTAAPNTQCNFIKWVDGAGTELSTNLTYTHQVTDDITVKGIFTINQYTLTFSAGEGGHVSATANNSAIASPATLDYNTSVTLTATPSANCTFIGWFDGNTQYSSIAVYTTTLTANKNLEARFKKGTTIFFKPVDYWKEADARFAVYTWGGSAGDKWIEFEDYGCNEDIFTADIPAGYTGFKIVRLKPASADGYNSEGDGFNWANRWAETVNLTIPTGDNNLYDMTETKASTKLYFTPHENWKQANARFAAYFFGNGNKWVDLTHHNDGIYACDKPKGYTMVIFGRMNPGTKDNNFNEGVKWNKTGDIDIPTNGQNHYILTGGEWDGVTGEWHTAWDDRQWTTYAAPAYKLSIKTPKNGTITVTKDGNAVANGATLNLGDEIKITFTPADGYELSNYLINYASETETDGVYTVCGPTKIIAEFDPIAPSRTVYLRPNEDWLRDNPIMAAYAYNNSGNRWYVMNTTDDDYTGAYSCKIPSAYDKVIFVRLNPNGSSTTNDGFNWENMWNQTKGLTILDTDNDATNDKKMRFAIGDKIEGGVDHGRYDGAWEENTPIWALDADFNDWVAEKAVFKGYPGKLDIVPPFVPYHTFKLFNFFYAEHSNYFGNTGTMRRENSGQWWTMDVNEQANCQMKLDARGEYIYQLRFLTVGSELRKQISVTYPAEEVYTLLYEYTIDSQTKSRMSYEIAAVAGEKLDTVSFHVLKNASPQITLLKNSERQEEPISISVESDSVYNFVLQQTDGQARLLNAANPEVYTGNYYIRTDAAAGGWNAYKQAGNKMTYSSYANKNHNFDHYYCKWISNEDKDGNFVAHSNVKFCVANDYSHAISDELNGDDLIDNKDVATGCIPASANVRFAWDSQTNEVSRAYISGSAVASDRFLVLTGNEYLKDIEGGALNVSGLKANEALFADKQNWIYQLDVQANSNTEITLTAQYNGKVQTFFGTSKSGFGGEPIMQATNDDYHKVRMIYDFKTNNLIAAWLLDETQYPETKEVASNMLIIRENQDDANQINFSNIDNDDMEIYTAYAVMTFTKEWVKGANTRDRSEYWVSFPFDVNISDVFGFSEYGDQWIMLLYDGAARAKEGYWAESKGFWKYITNRNYTLKAGVGYVLKLNPNKMDFPNNSTDASLFFPSQGIPTVINAEPTQITVPAHQCTIERDNRNIYDSHWNLIGVPGYANLENLKVDKLNQNVTIENEARNLAFYYAYDAAENSYNTSLATATFKNMHAYMVQYAGELAWTNIQETPAQLAARHNSDAEPEKAIFRLELAQGEDMEDQTFVQLQQEGATAEFDMNVDMTKIINSGANIYTLTDSLKIQTAGNVLPFEETTVAVGVDIATAGEYTFRMPDGTEGMVVELIDYEANTTTNLLLDDYTVNLPTGSNETRFALNIKPEKTATSIESTTTPSDSNIRKFIIDGKLYLQKDGMLYDAQGKLMR